MIIFVFKFNRIVHFIFSFDTQFFLIYLLKKEIVNYQSLVSTDIAEYFLYIDIILILTSISILIYMLDFIPSHV